jgi:hypothetical protein
MSRTAPAATPAIRADTRGTLSLASFRLAQAEIDELRWVAFAWYEGDLGLKSNMGDQLDAVTRTANHNESDEESWHVVPCNELRQRKPIGADESMLRAAAKLRGLQRRLRRLSPLDAAALALTYVQLTRDLPNAYGDVGNVVLRLKLAHRLHALSRDPRPISSWLQSLTSNASSAAVVERLTTEADRVLSRACRAWIETRYSIRPEHR